MAEPDNDLSLDRLIEREGAALSRTAALYERDPAEREDLIQEIWLAIWRALRRLPLRDRQIVGLKLEGFANREIAEASGLTENNVAVRLNRARGRLKQLLEDPA